jgi:hypothetical protein
MWPVEQGLNLTRMKNVTPEAERGSGAVGEVSAVVLEGTLSE